MKPVYASIAAIDLDVSFNYVPYKNGAFDPATSEDVERVQPIQKAMRQGDTAAREAHPTVYYRVGKSPMKGELPPVSAAGGQFLILRQDVVDLLKQFNTGDAGFLPLELFDYDNVTPINAHAYLLAPGTMRPTIDHASPNLKRNRYSKATQFSLPYEADRMAEVVTLPQPDDDLALWYDEFINFAVFLSEPLAHALEAAGLDRQLKPVRLK